MSAGFGVNRFFTREEYFMANKEQTKSKDKDKMKKKKEKDKKK